MSDSTKWRMANFHAHARKFYQQSKKAAASIPLLDSLYRSFGYNIISISDYQYINRFESKDSWFIPVYEQGFQYYKNHHLVLNAKKVLWLDFPFRQTLSNKQFIIDKLEKDSSALISIVHPNYRKAFSSNDFKYLSNFNCFEIANHERLFIAYYDTILTEGHPVFILADDDAHDLSDITDVCSSFNMVNSNMVSDSILKCIRTGRSFGVKFKISSFKTNEDKKKALAELPEIKTIDLKEDTISIVLNKQVKTIRFIGQHGKERVSIADQSRGSYIFGKEDTYIRTEIECYDGTIYFLNPFFRYDGIRLSYYSPVCDIQKTWICRSVFTSFLLIIIILRYRKNV